MIMKSFKYIIILPGRDRMWNMNCGVRAPCNFLGHLQKRMSFNEITHFRFTEVMNIEYALFMWKKSFVF